MMMPARFRDLGPEFDEKSGPMIGSNKTSYKILVLFTNGGGDDVSIVVVVCAGILAFDAETGGVRSAETCFVFHKEVSVANI